MIVRFSKMHSLGNDFVVIDLLTQRLLLNHEQVKRICDRKLGIGCDQLLLVMPPKDPEHDFYYQIYNSDGSVASMCGNGARCFARFVIDALLFDHKDMILGTQNGYIKVHYESENNVIVDMGKPVFEPSLIPIAVNKRSTLYTIKVDSKPHKAFVVSMGNPHAIIKVDKINFKKIEPIGRKISKHKLFPSGVNVGFMQVVSRDEINLAVYERGAGVTLACGSNASAAVVAGVEQNLLNSKIKVNLPGGSLFVEYEKNNSAYLSGPTATVYQGKFKI